MKEPFALTTYYAWNAEKFEPKIRYGPPADWNTLTLPCEQGGFLDLLLNDGQIVTLANLLEVHRARVLDDQRKAAGGALSAAEVIRQTSDPSPSGGGDDAPPLTDEDDPKDPFAGDL